MLLFEFDQQPGGLSKGLRGGLEVPVVPERHVPALSHSRGQAEGARGPGSQRQAELGRRGRGPGALRRAEFGGVRGAEALELQGGLSLGE